MTRAKRILLWIAATVFAAALGAFVLYRSFLGFPGAPLERHLPADTLLFADIKNVRLAALRLSFDEQAAAALDVAKAISLALSDAAQETASPRPKLDGALLRELAAAFKTRLGLAALAPSDDAPVGAAPDFFVLARFHGNADRFFKTAVALVEPLRQAGEVGAMETEFWQGHILRALPLLRNVAGQPSALVWTVVDDAFIATLSSDALKRLLALQPSLAAGNSLEDRPELRVDESFVSRADLSLFVDLSRALPLLASWGDNYLQSQSEPLLRTVSATRFAAALGLLEAKSLRYAIQLDGDRPSYLELRYGERIGFFASVDLEGRGDENDRAPPLSSVSALSLDAGEALRTVKDAALRGAPLAVFPYIGWTTRFTKRAGLVLDNVLRDAFGPGFRYARSIAVEGNDEDARLVVDHTLSLELEDAASLEIVSNAYRHDLAQALGRRLVVTMIDGAQANVFETIDSDGFDRIGYCLRDGQLLIGFGRLEGFGRAKRAEAGRADPGLNVEPQDPVIGYGYSDYADFPSHARRLAYAFYGWANPDKPIPAAFETFDWESLSPLAIRRASATFDDGAGRIYSVAEQLP